MAAPKKPSLKTGKILNPNPELSRRKLDELAQELVAPLQIQAKDVDVAELKKTLGKDIGKVTIGSLQGKLGGHIGTVAGGYESKLWEKACC